VVFRFMNDQCFNWNLGTQRSHFDSVIAHC
jgi:hypothetical protein